MKNEKQGKMTGIVSEFKDVLKKATLNFSIESVQLRMTRDRMRANMISDSRDVIISLDIENDVFNITEKDIEYELNFSQPLKQLVPFLNLVSEDSVNIILYDEKMVMKSNSERFNIYFCSPEVVSIFESSLKDDVKYFLTLNIDDRISNSLLKIKKLGARFGNIYFNVENGMFNVEVTDKTNKFSNGMKIDLIDKPLKFKNLSLCFDYKNFLNLMMVLGNPELFEMKFSYVDDKSMGMMLVEKGGTGVERYYLMSKSMENGI